MTNSKRVRSLGSRVTSAPGASGSEVFNVELEVDVDGIGDSGSLSNRFGWHRCPFNVQYFYTYLMEQLSKFVMS